MQATVVGVQPHVTKQGPKGPYVVHLFTYQPDSNPAYAPKPPTTRFVFAEDFNCPDLAPKVLALLPGQRVQLTFVPGNNPKFKNLVDVVVLGAGAPPPEPQYEQQSTPPQSSAPYQAPTPAPQPQVSGRDKYWEDKAERDVVTDGRIVRECALKAGVELVSSLLARVDDKGKGYYPKTIKQELLAEEAIFFASKFEVFLLGAQEEFNPEQGLMEEEYPEPPFDEEGNQS